MSAKVRTAILIYIVILALLLIVFKDLFFDKDDNLVQFGLGGDQKLLTLPSVAIILAISVYILVDRYKVNLLF